MSSPLQGAVRPCSRTLPLRALQLSFGPVGGLAFAKFGTGERLTPLFWESGGTDAAFDDVTVSAWAL